jgi:hypothetical protein
MFEFKLYQSDQKQQWDSFIDSAKNGHFMFKRDFMEYHKERFTDNSLIIYLKNKLIALLPAHRDGSKLASHLGLSFGGLIVDQSMKLYKMIDLIKALIQNLQQQGFTEFIYKATPQHYQSLFSNEDIYSLSLVGSQITRRDACSVIDLRTNIGFEKGRRGCIKKAYQENLKLDDSTSITDYFSMIENLLKEKYDSKPVHNLQEMILLQSRFPENIKLYTARKDQELLAGIWIFLNKKVIKTQYIASTEKGRSLGAVDFIINELITNLYKDFYYFDFGTSVDQSENGFNSSLMAQKEMFGARTVLCDWYTLNLVNQLSA